VRVATSAGESAPTGRPHRVVSEGEREREEEESAGAGWRRQAGSACQGRRARGARPDGLVGSNWLFLFLCNF
jgi:hypothetical protein